MKARTEEEAKSMTKVTDDNHDPDSQYILSKVNNELLEMESSR